MPGRPARRSRGGPQHPDGGPSPARGYRWEPFAEGNVVSLRHGAHAARKVDPLAAELATGLLVDRPDLERFPEVLLAWARAEARCILLAEWQLEHGLIDDDGNVRGGRYVAQFERLASDLRSRLGLDPRSEAELLRDRAEAERSVVDLDAIRARGRAALETRSAPQREPEVGA